MQPPVLAHKERDMTGAARHVPGRRRGPVKKECRACSGLQGQPGQGLGRDVAQRDGVIGDWVRKEGKEQFTEDVVWP